MTQHIDTFTEYAQAVESVSVYPESGTGSLTALLYCTLGMNGEAGEFAEKIKKLMRDVGIDGVNDLTYDQHRALLKELGDVLWYVARTAAELGVPLNLVAEDNIAKLFDRRDRGVLSGSGDNR